MRIIIGLFICGVLIHVAEERALETGYDMGYSDAQNNEPYGSRFAQYETKKAAASVWKRWGQKLR